MTLPARQYTLLVPEELDVALRRRARRLGKSLEQVALEALAAGAGLESNRDLSEIVGSMSPAEALRMEAEIRRQRPIDPKLWP